MTRRPACYSELNNVTSNGTLEASLRTARVSANVLAAGNGYRRSLRGGQITLRCPVHTVDTVAQAASGTFKGEL